ncbi:LuxR C-terminal-related transcriptional regulator [Psychrobacter phenylpyruvicus]
MYISEHTVRNHVATLMSHFEVHNRTKIIIEAQRAGYLSKFD